MAVGYSVKIYYNEISGLYKRGGPGGGWIYRVSSQMVAASRVEAPKRTGGLARAHSLNRGRVGNQYMQTYHIQNSAEHALWVHEGTHGPILPDGNFLFLPAGYGHKASRQRSVKGQKANPWLERACQGVAARYGAVGGTW